jgi:hypothetical protein
MSVEWPQYQYIPRMVQSTIVLIQERRELYGEKTREHYKEAHFNVDQ